MKRIVLTMVLLITAFSMKAQIDEYSVLGLPVATTAQIMAVTPLSEGALVYSTDEDVVYRYTSSGWLRAGNQTAADVNITDTGGNFSATHVEDALAELATATAENIYSTDGSLIANRSVTQNNFDLNFDANTLVIDGSANRVGVGTTSPDSNLEIEGINPVATVRATQESQDAILKLGTPFDDSSPNKAAIIAEGQTSYSRSKLHFALDDANSNDVSNEVGLSDAKMTIEYNGEVGIGITNPEAILDVNGDVRVRTLPTAADTDQLVTADSDGNLRKVNSLKASKIFYPPSIAIDASTNGTFTVDLYAQYVAQYGTPAIASAGAPAAIPTYGATDLYYYVSFADPDVFGNGTSVQNMSIDANGVLSYEIFNQPSDYNALINVVFVVK